MCFLSELLISGVMRCEHARAGHTQQHCLQTPGRDDVTLHEHMFCAYARAFPYTRSLLYRNDVCWMYERCSVCSLRKGWFSRLKRGKKTRLFSWPPYSQHTLTALRIMGESATANVENRKTRSGFQWDSALGLLSFQIYRKINIVRVFFSHSEIHFLFSL